MIPCALNGLTPTREDSGAMLPVSTHGLIVDCIIHGEIGRVPDEKNAIAAAAEMFRRHVEGIETS